MRSLPLAALVALAACSDDPPQAAAPDASPPADAAPDAPPATGPAQATVSHYDYHLDLASGRGVARLTLAITAPGDCVSVPFRPAAADDVTLDGVAARDARVENGALVACDPAGRGWASGRTVVLGAATALAAATWRPTQVGFSTRNDVEGRAFTYLLSWVGQCDRHGPCDSAPGRFATYRFTVDHPRDARVLCPGTVTAGDAQTVCEFRHAGGPTYSTFGIMAGRSWQPRDLGTAAGVRLTLHDIPASGLAAALDGARVRGFLAWMAETFGPYPYGDELRLVVAPTYWAGFEHPGNIALAETLARGNPMHTVYHEVAHQWAGDEATVASTRDFVWKEAMAEYLAFVWEDEHVSHATALASARVWKASATGLRHHPIPAREVPLVDFYSSAYGPGPMVLFRQLEVMYSRAAVLRALRALLGSPRALSVADVRRALEEATGAQLEAYVDNWLKGDGAPAWPTVGVTRDPAGGAALTLRVSSARPRGCRFTVRLHGAAGERLDVRFDLGADGRGTDAVTARPEFAVTRVEVDPDAEALVYPDATINGFAGARYVEAVPPTPWLAP